MKNYETIVTLYHLLAKNPGKQEAVNFLMKMSDFIRKNCVNKFCFNSISIPNGHTGNEMIWKVSGTMCLINPPPPPSGRSGEIRHKVQIPLCRHRLR